MANFLTLRTGGAAILKLDSAFYRGAVKELLVKRGLADGAFVDVDVAGGDDLEALFRGKVAAPQTARFAGPASSWRALLVAAQNTAEKRAAGGRDLGGDGAGAIVTGERDWVRRPGGKKVKQRVKGKRIKLPPAAPTPTTSTTTSTVTDPAAFAVQNLARLAAAVVDAIKDANDGALVAVVGGAVVVDGVVTKKLGG